MVLLNAVYPAITGSSGAIVDAASKVDDRIRSNIAIIQIADSDANDEVYIWIKNVGASSIGGISQSDVFFGPQGGFDRVVYGGSVTPYWVYAIEGGGAWTPSATLKITVHDSGALATGEYYFKVVIPNGISAQDYYSAP
jgi:archaellum component FlaG (FlaF/FlaG flagellin family)